MNLIFILKTICNNEFTYITKARLAQSGFSSSKSYGFFIFSEFQLNFD